MHTSSIRILTAGLVLFLAWASGASSQEQASGLTFGFRATPLRTVLDSLINRYGLKILCLDRDTEGKSVTAACQNCSVGEALDRILSGTTLTWQTVGSEIVIRRKDDAPASSKSTISGSVKESRSGEALIGATVTLEERNASGKAGSVLRRTATNKYGFFSIPDLPPGEYTVTARSLGHTLRQQTFRLEPSREPSQLRLELDQEDIELQEIVVERRPESLGSTPVGTLEVTPAAVKQLPSLGGEADLFRSLQLFPGIKAVSELSSGLYIRGGSPDQNLTLLDGVVVYNPYHLGGFLSTFNTDAINSIRVFKGGFPAEYGGRISSVIDLAMREGTRERLSGSAGISLLSSRLALEGPVTDKASFMISGRRMYLDLLLSQIDPSVPKYYFYDLNAKFNYAFSGTDHLYASGYFGRDVLSQPPKSTSSFFDIGWGNATGNLRWTHVLSPQCFLNLSAIYTAFDFSSLARANGASSGLPDFSSRSTVHDGVLRAEAQLFPDASHAVKAGLEVTRHTMEVAAFGDQSASLGQPVMTAQNGIVEAAAFIQDDWTLRPDLSANFGMRASYFGSGTYFRLEPRASVSYLLTDELAVKGSIGMAHQYLHLLTRNDISLPTDTYFPSSSTMRPERSWQAALGLERSFAGGEYFVSLETYYRKLDNLYDYRDDAVFAFGIPLASQITRGSGTAYGAELFLNKRLGPLTGWLGYTLSWTKRQFPDLNGGREFYPRFDRRHDISAAVTLALSKSWEFSATWTYGTGQAYTMPTGQFLLRTTTGSLPAIPGFGAPVSFDYAERNGYRLPPFHKLDIGFTYRYSWFSLPFQLSLNVYNVYNRKNPFVENLVTTYSFYGSPQPAVQLESTSLFPILPTIGLSVKF